MPPKDKVKGEFHVQLLDFTKMGIYVNSNKIKRYQDGFRYALNHNKDDFGLKKNLLAYNSAI